MKKLVLILSALFSLGGAVSATSITYLTTLNGANENPAVATPATGSGFIIVDNVANTLTINFSFSGLLGNTTASHIHCCAVFPANAGVATTTPTFAGFPTGVTSGTYSNTLDLTQASSYNPLFVTAQGGISQAEAALIAGIASGQAYLNVHSSVFPGGEIRGYFTPAPEPATILMSGIALAALTVFARIRARP